MKTFNKIAFFLLTLGFCSSVCFAQEWKDKVKHILPEFGHRNWIVIADAAYPKQSAPGIETIAIDAEQLEVVNYVLNEIKQAKHILPKILIDMELDFVAEKNAPGINAYSKQLTEIFSDQDIKKLPHEDIIRKLDEASKLFNILILKTNMTIPYTSIFIELDCGYWNAQKEAELRKLIKN